MAGAAKTSDVVVKEEPNDEALGSAVTIKSEVVSDEHDCDDDQPKRVQLPSSSYGGQALWTDVRCRDDARPHRAIASVAPTPLNKLEGSETVQVAGHALSPPPHFPLVSPPPLAPLSGAHPLKMAAVPDARRGNSVTSAIRLSPALNASVVSRKAQTGFVSCPPIAVDRKWENGRRPQSPVVLRCRSRSRSRSRSPALDSDFEPDVGRTPSPEPQRINEVIRRSDRST